MLVANRMTREPITVRPDDTLIHASHQMKSGGFRRLPVVSDGKLVGIITDRDLREHRAHLEDTKVYSVMTGEVVTVSPETPVEEAAHVLLERQIGGVPVVSEGRLVGVITATDILQAFVNVMGASQGGSTRIDFVLEGEEHGLVEATRIVAREGGDVLGVGTYRETLNDYPVCYLRLFAPKPDKVAAALRASGFNVLGLHRLGGENV
jgi:acetoin utilization protein AcuB